MTQVTSCFGGSPSARSVSTAPLPSASKAIVVVFGVIRRSCSRHQNIGNNFNCRILRSLRSPLNHHALHIRHGRTRQLVAARTNWKLKTTGQGPGFGNETRLGKTSILMRRMAKSLQSLKRVKLRLWRTAVCMRWDCPWKRPLLTTTESLKHLVYKKHA